MGQLLQVTPFLHIEDIDQAVRFFVETLGFTCPFRAADYAYVQRDHAAFRLIGRPGATPVAGNRRFAYYIDVRDVDALHAELADRLAVLPAGDVIGPIDQDYGQRELLVLAPDGNLLAFGSPIRRAAESGRD